MEIYYKGANLKKKVLNLLKQPTIIVIIIATIFRFILAQLLGNWYPSDSMHDDQLLIQYAFLLDHFFEPTSFTLVKNIAYPLFIDFVYLTGISYTHVLTIVWVIAAYFTLKMFSYLTKNKWFLVFSYIYVLFIPTAFEVWMGTRLYRNSIIAPFVLLTFALMLILLFRVVYDKGRKIGTFGYTFALGLVFSFTYFIKEDGFWLMPCLLLTILVILTIIIYRKVSTRTFRARETISTITLFLVPLLIFVGSSNIYKSVNHYFFGVYEINTRTEGELGEFVNNIYKIQSNNRTTYIWAPYDAIEKAFKASPTFQKHPELIEEIKTTPWSQGDILQNPIYGDFLTWVLRDALVASDLWESEVDVSNLFGQINHELDKAFKTGKLEKDTRIQITSSAGGKTISEIFNLKREVIQSYKGVICLDGYVPGGIHSSYENLESCERASFLTNLYLMPSDQADLTNISTKKKDIGNTIVTSLFIVYSIINPVFFVVSILSMILSIIKVVVSLKIRKFKLANSMSFLIMFVLLGISFVYALGIGWFAGYVWKEESINLLILNFQSIGMVPIIYLFMLFGLLAFTNYIKKMNISPFRIKKHDLG